MLKTYINHNLARDHYRVHWLTSFADKGCSVVKTLDFVILNALTSGVYAGLIGWNPPGKTGKVYNVGVGLEFYPDCGKGKQTIPPYEYDFNDCFGF